jgi:hypothetical protein
MRLSHRAGILALAGWLLMLPPPIKQGGKLTPNTNAPLSDWKQRAAYDTARECEAARFDNFSTSKLDGDGDMADVFIHARCVPAEHLYPPKEPEK